MTATSTERQNAVDFLELEILEKKRWRRGQPFDETTVSITLPLPVARIVLACAKDGLHKGQGRRRPALTRGEHLRRQNIYYEARRIYHQLRAEGRPATEDTKEQAAEEARVFGNERYGLNIAAKTIRTKMFSAAGLRPRIVSNPYSFSVNV
jgi:hypothetical protein